MLKIPSILFVVFFSSSSFAALVYDEFENMFDKRDRPATIEDLRRIDKCSVSYKDAKNEVYEVDFTYNPEMQLSLGPVLGNKQVENFAFGVFNNPLDLNEHNYDIINHRSLIFRRKDEDQTSDVRFNFGYEGRDIVLVDFEQKVYTGHRDIFGNKKYTAVYALGQCTLK